jgi:hypothetical protein
MDAAINHKEIRTDKGSDFLADDFLCDICVPVPYSHNQRVWVILCISLHCCKSEVNQTVLLGHQTITDSGIKS